MAIWSGFDDQFIVFCHITLRYGHNDVLAISCGNIRLLDNPCPIKRLGMQNISEDSNHSQSALFKPRLREFSDTLRFRESVAPSGNSAEISTTTLTEAFGSETSKDTISSAI
jgi:hypothetical protein